MPKWTLKAMLEDVGMVAMNGRMCFSKFISFYIYFSLGLAILFPADDADEMSL